MLCKSQPVALLLLSAAGLGVYTTLASVCYPAYVPGSRYAVGAWVSKSVTMTSSILYTACTPPGVGACPPSGFQMEGGNSTTAKHNYQCNSNDWCSNIGFAPGSLYSDIAWTKENPACAVSES